MKQCKDAVPLLGPLMDSSLDDDDRAWVEGHLRGCPACSGRLAVLKAQGDALREVLSQRADRADFSKLAERVLARVHEDRERAPVPVWFAEMWRAHHTAFTAAGSIAVAAAMALAVWFVPPRSEPVDEPVVVADASQPQLDEVDFGSHDGAVVELRDNTPVIWLSEDRQ